jgi:hypothetical protein
MKKIASIFLLLTVVIFMIVTFLTLQYQINANETDKFGYPFVFFSAANNAEIINITNFSGLALFTDLGICGLVALFIIYLMALIKPIKKNKIIVT